MNHNDAERISFKLATSWPRSSVAAESWSEELLELNTGPAEEAVRRLIRTCEHPPTIAQFYAVYRGLHGTAHEPACPTCGGDGWVTDTDHPRHFDTKGGTRKIPVLIGPDGPDHGACLCNLHRPCHCAAGKRAARGPKENAA